MVLFIIYAFHDTIIDWLSRPLPDGKKPITLGVTEPFTTSFKVSFYAAIALALPVLLCQLWASSRRRSRSATRRPSSSW